MRVTEPAPARRSEGDAERGRIAGRAGIVAAGTLASRLLGLGRDVVLAAVFSRAVTDAFTVAYLLPNLLRQLLAEGGMQTAVLPVLAATREREGDAAAREFYAAARGLSIVVLIAATVLGVLLAPQLVWLFAGGAADSPGLFERTVTLTRWLFPYLFFMGAASLGMVALNVHGRFVASSFAPALQNVAFIVAGLALPAWLVGRGHDPMFALVAAVLAGGALQVAAQWPSLARIGFLGAPRLDLAHPRLREALRRLGPTLFGTGVYLLDTVVARRFLSEMGVGPQSYFAWALRLCDFPQGIFVMALQSATLPSLAVLAARGDLEEVRRTFAFGLRLALFVAVPATALFAGLAEPLVAALFQRGQFDALATSETARALVVQGLGIWMIAAVRQIVGVFYALGDTRTPALVSGVDFLVFVAGAALLAGPWRHVGVAAALTLSSAVQLGLLGWRLRARLGTLPVGEVARSALRSAGASLLGLLAARGALLGLAGVGRIAAALLATALFAAVYLTLCRLLRAPELDVALAPLLRRLRGGARRA